MHTIIEIDLIAKRANERIAKEFAELGFSNPPVVTHGIVRAVLQAAEQSVHWTGGDSVGFCELHQISFLQAECPRCHPASLYRKQGETAMMSRTQGRQHAK